MGNVRNEINAAIKTAFFIILMFLIFYANSSHEDAGRDVECLHLLAAALTGLVLHATTETAAVHHHIHVRRNDNLNTAAVGVDVDSLVFGDDGFTEVEPDSTAEKVEAGTVERLAMIDIFVAPVAGTADDALALVAAGHGTLQKAFVFVLMVMENEVVADENQCHRRDVGRPGLLPQPVGIPEIPHVAES